MTVGTLAGLAAIVQVHTPQALAIAAGAWCGLIAGHLVTPDVDHPMTTIEEGRFLRLLGPLGRLWQAFWWPYTELFTHRGWSHTVPVGTLTRAAYLAGPAYLIYWLSGVTLSPEQVVYLPVFALAFFAGWMFQDMTHLALDGLLFSFLVPKKGQNFHG